MRAKPPCVPLAADGYGTGMAQPFGMSPLDTVVTEEDQTAQLWHMELRDLARGFSGALFVALPLLYTLEMWEIARSVSPLVLGGGLAAAYLANVGYAAFGSFKPEVGRQQPWLDGAVSLAFGFVASLVTLALIGRYTLTTPVAGIIDLAAFEAIPTSFGASIATKQLGTRYDSNPERVSDHFHPDVRKLLATVLGGLLFSYNIAPTVEPRLIATEASWWHVVALVLFSLAVSAVMTGFAGFVEREGHGGVLGGVWLETLVSYLVALVVSAALLWFFGYVGAGTPLSLLVKWVAILGYVTALGGSAGRLVL